MDTIEVSGKHFHPSSTCSTVQFDSNAGLIRAAAAGIITSTNLGVLEAHVLTSSQNEPTTVVGEVEAVAKDIVDLNVNIASSSRCVR